MGRCIVRGTAIATLWATLIMCYACPAGLHWMKLVLRYILHVVVVQRVAEVRDRGGCRLT